MWLYASAIPYNMETNGQTWHMPKAKSEDPGDGFAPQMQSWIILAVDP